MNRSVRKDIPLKLLKLLVIAEALANVHCHLREGRAVMQALIEASLLGGSDVVGAMPNTKKGLATARRVMNYIQKAVGFVPRGRVMHFIPIVMLTENTTREELVRCKRVGINDGKIYPYMRTTKSKLGVRQYGKILPVVKWCGELGIKVHVHFEHPNMVIGNRDAEYLCFAVCQIFLEETNAVIIWEHGSDARCIPSWKKFSETFPCRFYVTLTAHHLAWNEDGAFGDVRRKCKPPIKTEFDRLQLVQLVCEDHDWVMAGGDDAAHPKGAKHVHEGKCACGAATYHFLMQLYAHALDRLLHTKKGVRIFNRFVSRNARKLHNLPPASHKVYLLREPFKIPLWYQVGPWKVEPPGAGEEILYKTCAFS